jgi:phytoene dehydrogenase-like protein
MAHTDKTDVVVIGGGLAGLTAATILARAGKSVRLFEKAQTLGGRAATHNQNGFHFNLGPHALYRGGAGARILRDLGIQFHGGVPSTSGNYAIARGKKHTLPGGFVSLLTTSLFGVAGKLETARLLGALPKIDTQPLQSVTVGEWLAQTVHHPEVQQLLRALFRVSTYTNDPERQSAGAAIAQAQMALTSNVLYLDGGWQTLVDGLRQVVQHAGVLMETSRKVTTIEHQSAVQGVSLHDGTFIHTTGVVITGSPTEAVALVQGEAKRLIQQWAIAAVPVKAACLDVGLSRLPQPQARFALGINQPLYLSVHSAVAKLAPSASAVIHVAKYLPSSLASDAKADERELEALLDFVQPGWREVLVERRFMPHLTVSHALVPASGGGLNGRPGPAVPGVQNLYIAGDWVGPEGMLADASLASAKQAAELLLQRTTERIAA